MGVGQVQVRADLAKRLHMALARHGNAFGTGLPACQFQQMLAQQVQALPGFGGQVQARHLRIGRLCIAFVPHVDDRNRGGQFVPQSAGNTRVIGLVLGLACARQVMQKHHCVGV